MTRSRKHPLGLTLLSQNYKQLLVEFHEFQGHRGGSSSSSQSDGENCSDRSCTPPDGQLGQAQATIDECTPSKCSKPKLSATESDQARCVATTQRYQHATVGTVVAQASPPAAAAPGSSKRPQSNRTSTRTPPKQRTPIKTGSAHAHADGAIKQQQASPVAAAGKSLETGSQSAKAQRSAQRRTLQLQQLQHSSRRLLAANEDKALHVADVSSLQEAPDALTKPLSTAAVGSTPADKPWLRQCLKALVRTPPVEAPHAGEHKAEDPAAACCAASASAAGSASQHASAAADLSSTKSLLQQQPHKRSRRRVGDDSPPLSVANTCSGGSAAATSGAAAAAAAAAAIASVQGRLVQPAAASAASSRPHVELPRLPLHHLHSGPVLLPPLHPSSSRGSQLSAGSGKASKSEPASARMPRRTSDSSSEGSADGSSSRGGDSSVLAGASTVRHHSLPEALPYNRRHSIACLVDLSKRQLPRPQAASEGGKSPYADAGSNLRLPPYPQQAQQQAQQLQQLQPLKQLQELRRRGQLRAGADDSSSSSHDYQILVLEGLLSTYHSSKQGAGSSSGSSKHPHREPWQAGEAAAVAAGPDRVWPSLATDLPPVAGPPAHRRTRSSNTQLPPLDEHAVLADPPALPHTLQQQQQQGAPLAAEAGHRAASIPGLVLASAAAAGDASSAVSGESSSSSGFLSRRSSSDSSGGGLVCEPSSFGVCADPAGAVHLVTPAIPDKLARLKQRLPSRVTAESVAAAAAARRSSAEAAAAAGGAVATAEAPAAGGPLVAKQACDGPTPPAAGKKGRTRARWQLPAVTTQEQQPGSDEPPLQANAVESSQQQQHGTCAPQQHSSAGPKGARHSVAHSHPQAAQVWADSMSQQAQPVAPAAAAGQQPPQVPVPPAVQQHGPQLQQPPPLPPQQLQQQPQAGSLLSDLKHQLEHWARWVQMHCHNPQQVPPPPQLPPQLRAALMQQEEYRQHQQARHQQPPLQPQPYQQPFQQQQYALQQPGWRAAAATVPVGPAGQGSVGSVPAHGALSRFTDPLAERQHQRLLEQLHCTFPIARDTGGAAAPDGALQQQGVSWQVQQQQQGVACQVQQQQQGVAWQVQQQQQGVAWQVQQQQQGVVWQGPPLQRPGQVQVQDSPPSVVSAAALAQQRQVLQQEAFEGLSLEAVLASAKKTKPPSRRQLLEKAGHTAEAAG